MSLTAPLRRHRTRWLPVVSVLLLVAECATAKMRVPQMADPQSSAIGIQITVRAPIGIISKKPDQVYFVKLDNEGDITQNQVIPSNFTKYDRFYLLNAEPGKYAAVATFMFQAASLTPASQPGVSVSISKGGTTYTTYFPEELIEATKIDVERGEVAFMGSYVVKASVGLKKAEPIQKHYVEIIAPGSSKIGLLRLMSGDWNYRGTLKKAENDSDARKEFIKKATNDLSKAGWGSILK